MIHLYIGSHMEPLNILLILLGLLIVATLAGFVWQNRQGSISRSTASDLPPDVPLELVERGSIITLLQFSGPFCSYCQAMRGVLGREAATHDGAVAHREIDITDYPELTRTLRVNQTPTTFLVTSSGHIVSRIHGAAKPPIVANEVATALSHRKAQSDEYLI
ncbi:MAG: hypothetical protein RL247_445 [Actinomycetota bacterium]